MTPLPLEFVLETPRLLLRAPCDEDADLVFSASRHKGFTDGMLWEPPASIDEVRLPLARSIRSWVGGEAYTFTIVRREDGVGLGRISIRETDPPTVLDIGFWLHPDYQGQGFMTEAARAVLILGFGPLQATAIEAAYATWNVRSKRVLNALGMMEVEFLEKGFMKRGEWISEYRVRIERPAE